MVPAPVSLCFLGGFFCLFVFLDYKLESKAILFLQGGHWSQE